MLQPYLIGLLLSKGVPMLWQGQEFGENYFLPDFGAGRVSLLRPLRWDYFYDTAGQQLVRLVRTLIRTRRARPHMRRGKPAVSRPVPLSSTIGTAISATAC